MGKATKKTITLWLICALIIAFTTYTARAQQNAADHIAASLWRLMHGPDPDLQLDVFAALREVEGHPEQIVPTYTEVLPADLRSAHRRAAGSGDCALASEFELTGFLGLYPKFRQFTADSRFAAKIQSYLAGTSEASWVCAANRRITETCAKLSDEERSCLPLRGDAISDLDRESEIAAGKLISDLHLLEISAVCGNDPIALESLLKYMHIPQLIAYEPEIAGFLFALASKNGLETYDAQRSQERAWNAIGLPAGGGSASSQGLSNLESVQLWCD